MDPWTGEILAMANSEGYDLNGVTLAFEPGSTFKLVTAAIARETKAVEMDEKIYNELGLWEQGKGEKAIRNSHRDKEATSLNITEAMAESSNIVFAKIADSIGASDFYKYATLFGFNSKTGIELEGESKGRLTEHNTWERRDLRTLGFGHYILVTPLQMVAAYAAIANGGVLLRPTLVKEWRTQEGSIAHRPDTAIGSVVSQETAAEVRSMLEAVVDHGTAKIVRSKYFPIAGKTGTAEKFNTETGKYDRNAQFSSFIGFVPVSEPQFVGMVLLDDPKMYTSGGMAAGPVFREIVERIYLQPESSPASYNRVAVRGESPCAHTSFINLSKQSAQDLALVRGCPIAFEDSGSYVMSERVLGDTVRLVMRDWTTRTGKTPNMMGLSLKEALEMVEGLNTEVEYKGTGWVVDQYPRPFEELPSQEPCRLILKENVNG
jgi:cell division protein FtsI/penicillin-binding protein 2